MTSRHGLEPAEVAPATHHRRRRVRFRAMGGNAARSDRARPRAAHRCPRGALVVLAAWIGVVAMASWAVAAPPSDRYRPPDGWRLPPAPSPAATAPAPAPAGAVGEAPDVLLIVFSGRCALSSCTPPDENEDALARTLVPAVVAAVTEAGFRVEVWTYRAHAEDDPGRGRGYRSALSDLEKAVQDGVLGPHTGARPVLVGYSHGTQFAHLFAFEHPDVPFAASVLLDSICLGWDADHAASLVAAFAPGAGPWAADGPYEVGCDVLSIPGMLGHLDLGDVVPWNVARSLEVRTGGQVLGAVRDVRTNVRPDGSRVGLDVVDLPALPHREVDEPGGAAFDAWIGWLLEVLRADRARSEW
jgi:hypothetical protein